MFYCLKTSNDKFWDLNISLPPLFSNFNFFTQLPADINYDVILCFSERDIQKASEIAHIYHVPVALYRNKHNKTKDIKGIINVFLTHEQKENYNEDGEVLGPGIDTELFIPDKTVKREKQIITVIDKFNLKPQEYGYRSFLNISKKLPIKLIGNNAGLSKPLSIDDLITEYQKSTIYLNLSETYTFPLQILEAMACGCCIVSKNTGSIMQYAKHCFISDNDEGIISHIKTFLECEKLAEEISKRNINEANTTFCLERYLNRWNVILSEIAKQPYKERIYEVKPDN